MHASRPPSAHHLLTMHFVRQFLDNDLISPDADRSQLIAVVGATTLSLTLFVSAMLSFKYVGPLMSPGLAAVLAFNDRYFYLALGMVMTALVAASQWDALSIDARDAAILEPLPVQASTIRRAKLSAVAILGVAVSIAVTVCPSIVFPPLLVYTFTQMSAWALLALMAAHVLWSVAASLFGYLVVVALRELMMAVLGVNWFSRVSPWVQGALITLLGGSLLLLPAASGGTAERGFAGWKASSPPMWFASAYELTVGGLVVDLPRKDMRPRQAEQDRAMTALYQTRRRDLPAMAARAGTAVGMAFLAGLLGYLWNARRLRSLATAPLAPPRRQWARGRAVLNAMLLRRAAARAGFYFAIAAMWRSKTHRLTLACAGAVGLAMIVVAVSSFPQQGGAVTARLLAVQPLLYGALLVGFRHAIRVPAELRANWGVQLAWRGQERTFVGGVKAAALVALVLPALVVLLPVFAVVLTPDEALLHAALGLTGAVVFLEALMLGYEKVPFTCTYLPSEKIKALAPVYAIAFVVGATLFGRMQLNALRGSGLGITLTTLASLFVVLRIASATRRARPVQFDEAPVTFQRLGLDG
jgi:hypothetical protein